MLFTAYHIIYSLALPNVLADLRSHRPMYTKRMQKNTEDDQSVGIGVIRLYPFSSAPKIDKTVEKFRKQNGKERTRVVCSRDVKQMNIGRLVDESGLKRTKTLKGLSGIISKQTYSGKRRCITYT